MAMIQVDDTLKQAADSFFMSLDTDTDTAVRMFLIAAVKQNYLSFPTDFKRPTPETMKALEDARLLRNLSGPYRTGKEAVAAMLED